MSYLFLQRQKFEIILHLKGLEWIFFSWNQMKIKISNKSNIFLFDRGINQKRMENCINARRALFQKIRFLIPYDLHCF